MFTQTFVHNNEKYAVIEGTMSSISRISFILTAEWLFLLKQ